MWVQTTFFKFLTTVVLANYLRSNSCSSVEVDNVVNGPLLLEGLSSVEEAVQILLLNARRTIEIPEKIDLVIRDWLIDYKESSVKVLDAIRSGNWPILAPLNPAKCRPEQILSGHPLLVYRMTRRFTHKLKEILSWIASNERTIQLHDELSKTIGVSFPSNEHLNNSIRALFHIQEVYDITPSQMANGDLGVKLRIGLNLEHIVEIGMFGVDHFLFALAADWLILAKNIHNKIGGKRKCVQDLEQGISKLITQHDFYWEKASSGHMGDDFSIELFLYTTKIKNGSSLLSTTRVRNVLSDVIRGKVPSSLSSIQADLLYYALCKGEILQSQEEMKTLKCYYERRKSPEFLFYPAKIEELSKVLKLVKIHQLIGPKFATRLKELAAMGKYVSKYKVRKDDQLDATLAKYLQPQAQPSWIPHAADPKLNLLKRRVQSITGISFLTEKATEPWNVVAYSPGGGVGVHHDTTGTNEKDELRGRRIATLYVYMHSPFAGGQTSFPTIGVAPAPESGSAIFWENLSDGRVDLRALHAACPVILGTKWALLTWATESGNPAWFRCSS